MINVQSVIKFDEDKMQYIDIFHGIFQHSPNGIIVTDKDLNIKLFNENAEKLTGLKKEEVIGSQFYDVFPHIPQLNLINSLDETVINISLINGKNLHTRFFTIKDVQALKAVVFLMQDLSEDIKLTLELEKSQHIIEELERILEGSFDGLLVTDGEGNVLMVNKSYERITSIRKEELLGRNMRELINPVWMKNSVVFLAIKERKPISMPHTTRENKNIIVTGTPIFDKYGNVKEVVVNARDISEIYELREELLKAKEMEKLYFNNFADSNLNKGQHRSNIVVVSDAIREAFSLAHKVSNFDATVLIEGESGSGKEEIAKYIHENSLRKDKQLVVINCGAIPEQLLESELFGYEKGAFTGASREGKIGLYEVANGGTLFLDEIGEMPLNLQVKLLRALETGQINRVGSIKPVALDVRVIAATNKNLEKKIQKHEFREDLFYRLNVIQIKVPPLRDRIDDIAPLALHFLQLFNSKYGQSKKLTYEVIKELEEFSWTGNIRQLKNMIENMVIVSNNEYLQINDLPWHRVNDYVGNTAHDIMCSKIMPLDEAIELTERQLLRRAKERYQSTRKIAKALQIDQSTVVRKMKKYGLSPSSDEEMPI